MRTLLWFRGKDLRLSDHPALHAALEGDDVIPLFVLDPFFFAPQRARELPHRMQFLLESLAELQTGIAALGSRLLLVPGRSLDIVPRVAALWRVDQVLAMRWTEPLGRERDRRIAEVLPMPFHLFEGETLVPPGSLRTGQGAPYSVFTAFARAFHREFQLDSPLPAPEHLPHLPVGLPVEEAPIPLLEALGILRNPKLQRGGESEARARLVRFLDEAAPEYERNRDRMDLEGTSRLSADLHFGTLSIRTVWHEAGRALGLRAPTALASFRNELLWREFTHSTLWDHPEMLREPLRKSFLGFPWREDEDDWRAWGEGRTGYPVVDAAARQLLSEGFVHNRARMIAASFLVKDLFLDYRRGEAHYLKFLADGDAAQNNGGWQWSTGCGFDAQPFFRVFNPALQGRKFDPTGVYVRRWVPELAALPDRWLHEPWEAPAQILETAGIMLGRDYPLRIVNHGEARERFLSRAKAHLGASSER